MEGKWLSTSSIHPLIKCRLHAGVDIVKKESAGDGVVIPHDDIQDMIEEFRQKGGHEVDKVDEIKDEEQPEEGEGDDGDGDIEIEMDGYDEDQVEGGTDGDMEQ